MENDSEGREYLSLDEIHAELVGILKTADPWLQENGIRYSLSDGSLLGAIRHKGFIPWDDDLDIYMPRPDYEKWLSLESEFVKATGFKIRSCRTGSYHYPFSKIINPVIRAQEESVEGAYEGYLWVDVFPIDAIPSDAGEYKKLLNYRNLRLKLINLALTKGSKNKAKAVIKAVSQPLFSRLVNPIKLANQIDERCRSLNYATAERVACPVYGFTFAGKSIPREGFEATELCAFEDTKLPCMSCWDEYLSQSYGDYMQLPPENKRWHHPQKTWRVDK